jgi:hypothetical protein
MHILYYSPVFFALVVFTVMWWFGKLPTVNTIHDLAEISDTKGGNILLLYTMSFVYFFVAVRFGYWIIAKSGDGKVSVENALVMAMFGFITGSAFGGSFSAMIKTMTGGGTLNGNGGTNGKTQGTVVTTLGPELGAQPGVSTPSNPPGSDK